MSMGKSNRLKRPTRAEKALMESKRLNADNWLVAGKTEEQLFLHHKQTGNQKTLNV